jgi:signal transduction histidine kinase/ActR/RegA family two-component response regulator
LVDPTEPSAGLPPVLWHERIDARVVAGFVLLLLLIATATGFYLWTNGRSALTEQSYLLHEAEGNTLVSHLEQQFLWAEALVTSLADVAANEPAPLDINHIRGLVPAMLRQQGKEGIVAGGGVWPEPGEFVPGEERASLFWGRDAGGHLVFYDNYNAPDGPGYHREEWYVPAKRLQDGEVYWSKTYMDPYTFQPMVTCTAPMIRDGRFIGVATVDLKLEGIRELVSAIADRIHGYAFILDRNDTFVCYPDDRMVQRTVVDDDGNRHRDFLGARAFATEHEEFAPVAHAVERIDRIAMDKTRPGDDAGLVARALVLDSDSIEAEEALRIVAMFREQDEIDPVETHLRQRITLDQDILFDEPVVASVFFAPRMFWKVVTVTPESVVTAGADRMVRESSVFAVVLILLAALLALAWIRVGVVAPLGKMTRNLKCISESGDTSARLPRDAGLAELKQLAHWFNHRTQLLDEARQASDLANRTKSEFLANMSHEIRSPMTAILGYVDLLSDPDQSAAKHDECLHVIKENGDHLLRIIDDILDLSRLELGGVEIHRVSTDVVEIVRGVQDLMSLRARKRGIVLGVEIDPSLPLRVETDPLRVRQVLVNLVGNAVKYTDEGSVEIRVHWRPDEGDSGVVAFEVADTGIGLTPEQQSRLFLPFVQGDPVLGARENGSGLGLSIARGLARRLGGDITVESVPQRGSRFRFLIDAGSTTNSTVADVAAGTVDDAPDPGPHPGAELPALDARILVVEDLRSTRRLLRLILESVGAQVEEAENGRRAVERALVAAEDGAPFDAIVMDMRMPEMDGYQATRQLRAVGYTGHIIACTAEVMAGDAQRCLAAGCDDHIGKPIDKGLLIRKLADVTASAAHGV